MIKKLFFFIILIFTLYIVLIFISPSLSDKIEWFIWLNWINNKIRDLKLNIDETYTNLPSKEQFIETYNDAKVKVEIKTMDTLSWVNDVKNTIDDVRNTLSWAANTYSEIKWSIDETKTQIESSVNAIKDTAETISNVTNTLNNTISGGLNNN